MRQLPADKSFSLWAVAQVLGLLLLFLLILGSKVHGAISTSAVVSVGRDIVGTNEACSATGTVIDKDSGRGIVLTVAHVLFMEGRGACWVGWHTGQRVGARILFHDQRMDFAVLETPPPPPDVEPIPLADKTEHAPPDAAVEFLSLRGGRLNRIQTTILGYENRDAGDIYRTQLRMAYAPRSGDSGGPIIYQDKVVGVNWGGPAGADNLAYEGQATYCGKIALTLDRNCNGWRCQQHGGIVQQGPPPIPRPRPAPQPVVQAPSGESCNCDGSGTCKCDAKKVAALEARIAMLEARSLVPGPRGDKGDAGQPCDPGLIAAALSQIKLPVEVLDAAGKVRQSAKIPLDGNHPLKLQLVPLKRGK